MRILFACGGTAGHINPALAVADILRRENKDTGILFAGNPAGMEARLVPQAGFDFAPIEIQGFRRSLTPGNIRHNLLSLICLASADRKARLMIKNFSPEIIMGTGGYVSGPVLRAGAKMGIPTVTHEQNALPGVTTKLLTKYVDKVLLSVEEAKAHLPVGRNYAVVGNPIREDIIFADRVAARERLGVRDKICLLSFGGSLGAEKINESMAEVISHFHAKGNLHHLHAVGRYGIEEFLNILETKGVPLDAPHIDIRKYIDDMPDCLAAADLVICRSGAISISEVQAAGRASILIPSPNVAGNHQYHNAMVLSVRNAAIVIEEKALSGSSLCETVENLVDNPSKLQEIGRNAASMAVVDAGRRIVKELADLKPTR